MIFITVGTQKFQFNRLLKAMDELVSSGRIAEKVYAQTGHSNYLPRNYSFSAFLNKDVFNQYVAECDLLVTHSGVATIISGMKCRKPIIVMPRLARYGEHVDDHQVQIAASFGSKNYVLYAKDESQLADLISISKTHAFDQYISRRSEMITTIKAYMQSMK